MTIEELRQAIACGVKTAAELAAWQKDWRSIEALESALLHFND